MQLNRAQFMEVADRAMQEMITLCRMDSPTGYTEEIQAYVLKRLTDLGFQPWSLNKGGIFCELSRGAKPNSGQPGDNARILSAHLDTLGLMVRSIKANGRLRATLVGGFPFNYVEQENVRIHTRDGKIYEGSVHLVNPSVHNNREAGETKRNDETCEVVIDEVVKTREDVEKLGISAGDFICLESRARLAGDGFMKSRHLDDKASSAMLLALAEEVAAGRIQPSKRTYLFFSVFEEVGHGACGGHPQGVRDFLAFDMGVVGTDLDTDEYVVSICAKDSSGPYNYNLTNELIQLAKQHELNYAVDIYPFYGSDASAAAGAGHDYRFALLGTGVARSHGYERIHRLGVANSLELVAAYMES